MDQFIEQIITGLSIGSILLLVALGLSIIYGSMGIINLAHGEFVMLGAYTAWLLQSLFRSRIACEPGSDLHRRRGRRLDH